MPCDSDFDLIGQLGGTVGYQWGRTLICYQGATVSTPVRDLTGFTADMEVRDSDGNLIARISTTPGGTHGSITITGASGSVALLFYKSHLSTVAPGMYRYELRLVDGSGNDQKLFTGKFEIKQKLIGAANP